MANNNLQDVILKAIDIIATKKVKQAGYDKTVLATVISCEDEKKGKYKVKYQDSYWIAYSNNINILYSQGSSVYILIPSGDMSKNKTILGGVKQLGVNYKALTQDDIVDTNEQIFILQGQNVIEDSSIWNLCSYKQDIKVLYTKSETQNLIDINKDAAKQYFKDSTNFSISMNVQNTLVPQQRYKGNYGVIVGIDFEDNSTGALITRYYTIDIDSMMGNPYYFPEEVPQSKIFEIDGQHFVEINSIILFAKDFPIQKDDEPDDIFISNLSIGAVSILSSNDLSGYLLTLITPRGYIFNKNSTNNEERLIQAQVRSHGKVLNFETSDIEIFWFRENASVTTNHDKYSKYGGQGWECLNEYGIIEQAVYDVQGNILEPAIYGFRPGSETFSVKKSDVLAYTTKYKCVAIYEGNIMSKEMKIIRQDSNYEFSITSNAGTAFYYDTGSPTLTCHCRQKDYKDDYVDMDLSSLKFVWSAINNVGNFQSLQSIENAEVDKNKLILIKNAILEYIDIGFISLQQIFNIDFVFPTDYTISEIEDNELKIKVEKVKQDLVQGGITSQNDITNLFSTYLVEINSAISYNLLLNGDVNHERTLTNAINNYATYQKIVENQIINLNIKNITKFSTYKCSVFTKQGNQYLGSASITITNSLSAENEYTLVIENGTQVFKYDTMGISPASKRKDRPLQIPLLSFSVYDSQGNRIDDDIISKCENSWTVPITDTMLKPNSGYSGGIPTVDQQNMVYKNLSIFAYSIAETYNNNRTRNNIILQVNYNGMVLNARTNLSFLKDGEEGTNGTDFVCKIIPNAVENVPITPTIYYDGSKVSFNWDQDIEEPWFQVQLWHNDNEPIFTGVTSGNSTEGKFVTVVKWEVLKNVYYSNAEEELNIQDKTNLKVKPTTNEDSWQFSFEPDTLANSWDSTSYKQWRPANILKVTINYDGVTYYGTLPVIVCRLFDNIDLIDVNLKDYTGFNRVLYNSAGMKPQYDSHAPFEVLLEKKDIETNEWKDSSLDDDIYYQWFYMGSVWYKNKDNQNTWEEEYQETQEDESSKKWLTKSYMAIDELQKNQKSIKPIDTYNGECLNIGLVCRIYQIVSTGEKTLAWMHIPIHFSFNRFENSAINSWDGNSVNLGGDNGGMILSPQAGSGYKDSNNKFTGVVMGTAKDPKEQVSSGSGLMSNYDTGLFGYHSGVRTFFLDSKTGKATFGQTGQAQIIIDPTQINAAGRHVAQIKSGNYDTQNKTGLLIDLSTPEIKYGSGNFYVDKDGFLHASGAEIEGTLSVHTRIKDKNDNLKSLIQTLDSKVQTWYQNTDPSLDWAQKDYNLHQGDLWYCTQQNDQNFGYNKTYRWSGSEWIEQTVSEEVSNFITSKGQIFTGENQPEPPYQEGDIWFTGAEAGQGDIKTCVHTRQSGTYVSTDWQKRNKYTDDSAAEKIVDDMASYYEVESDDIGTILEAGKKAVLIEAKNYTTDEISRITVGPDSIRLQTATLVWKADNSTLDEQGNFWCQKADISGAIHATSLTLDANAKSGLETALGLGQGSTGVYVRRGKLYGASSQEALERQTGFIVSNEGLLKASNAIIWGTIHASAGEFAGKITASEGKIGGFTIKSTWLEKWSSYTSGVSSTPFGILINAPNTPSKTNFAFAVRSATWTGSKFQNYKYPFYVKYSGELYAENADIKGKITATEGSFGPLTIETIDNQIFIHTDKLYISDTGLTIQENNNQKLSFSIDSGNGYITLNSSGGSIYLGGRSSKGSRPTMMEVDPYLNAVNFWSIVNFESNVDFNDNMVNNIWIDAYKGGASTGANGVTVLLPISIRTSDGTVASWKTFYLKNGFVCN